MQTESENICAHENLTTDIKDFKNVCRICMTNHNLQRIFDITYKDIPLCDMFYECVAVKVESGSNYPENICMECICELIHTYTFIEKCRKSQITLEKLIYGDQISELRIVPDETKPAMDDACITIRENPSTESKEKTLNKIVNDVDIKIVDENNFNIIKSEQVSPFFCDTCFSSFESLIDLRKHRKERSHRPRNSTCKICSKTFTQSKLRVHMRTHTKEKPFVCMICAKGFNMRGNLSRHMMTHTGERPHKCDICGKGFIQAPTLAAHRRTHTGETPYVCNYCGKRFIAHSTLYYHILKHKLKNGEATEEIIKQHKCEICDAIFVTKASLRNHKLIHGEKTFLCSECGKGFSTNAGLLVHIKIHTGEKPYTCKICNKSFSQTGALKIHSLIHTGEKPYTCKICNKSFTQNPHLKYHMRVHSGERPYKCSHCGKRFTLKSTLTVHMRMHTGETPYACSTCGKRFYDASSMRKHNKGCFNI